MATPEADTDQAVPAVAPHSEAYGTDICCSNSRPSALYIIRSDLGCYMRAWNGTNQVLPLHPLCQGGDHYMHHSSLRGLRYNFYIIKGDTYYRVTDLSTAAGAKEGKLHEKCQGGDFYMARLEPHRIVGYLFGGVFRFMIIFSSAGKFRVVTDLETDANAQEFVLHESFRDGLYYWAEEGDAGNVRYCYCLKQVDSKWGLRIHRASDMTVGDLGNPQPFDPDVSSFLPGGLSVRLGPTIGQWHCIDRYVNDSNEPFRYNRKVIRKVGYKKEVVDSIEHNWKISGEVKKDVSLSLIKAQIALSGSYGGKKLDSTKEEWSEERTVEETVDCVIQPGQGICIWQYKLTMGQDQDLLLCEHKRVTDTPDQPEDVPLPTGGPLLPYLCKRFCSKPT